jgi:hypothetical protein
MGSLLAVYTLSHQGKVYCLIHVRHGDPQWNLSYDKQQFMIENQSTNYTAQYWGITFLGNVPI